MRPNAQINNKRNIQNIAIIMKAQIINALKSSLIGDTITLQKSSEALTQMSNMEGYCMNLMEIVDDASYDISLKQAALVQLKNNIRTKWKPTSEKIAPLTPNQKNSIRGALVLAVIRCAKNYMLIKIYRDVLTTVINFQFQSWIPLNQILAQLKSGQNLAPTFHCIIAICTNFQFSILDKQKLIYNEFLKQILPAVFQTVKNNINNAELIYLSIKILWKSVHYQISNEIKLLTNTWMQLLQFIIESFNEEMQKKLDEIQARNTPQFYYYHSKKWATRILMRFVTKHAKSYLLGKPNQENLQFSNQWYEAYGFRLCSIVVKNLQIPTTKKIRYFQLKIIQGIVNDRPQIISEHSKLFQYDILLKYMKVTPEDEKLAKEDVVEYMRIDQDGGLSYSNIKAVATQVWKLFMQIGSKLDRDKNFYQPGPFFQDNLQFMFKNITSQNLIEKQLGMYLFCQNRLTINRIPEVKAKMPQVIEKYVIPQLANPAMLIRARANDMLFEYGKQIHDFNICSKAIQGMYKCLTSDESPLVRIKAAIALNPLISHQQSKNALKPYLKQILQVYLKLIQQYDLQQIVSALQYFITDFSQSIGPYALDLFKYLSGIFVKMFNKDIEQSQNQQYNNEIEVAASGCLKTMTQIIESPLDPKVRQDLQASVLDLCAFLFTNQCYDYFQEMMYMLRVHVFKVQKISHGLWFFYQIIIYFIAGIPNQMRAQIQGLNIPQVNKQILASVRKGNNIEYLEYAVPVLRNYLGKGYQMIVAQKQQFKTNLIHLIFYMISYVYKKFNQNENDGQLHYDCCTIMLVYLIETFPPEMTAPIVPSIWNILKFNNIKLKSIYIKQISVQLIAVLLWKHPTIFLGLLAKQNQLKYLYSMIKKGAAELEEMQQRKRLILGICSYLVVAGQQFAVLGQQVPTLFKISIKLIRKNCRSRIILNTQDPIIKRQLLETLDKQSDNENDHLEAQHQSQQDDEDLWDEEYYENHTSILKRINQLQYFKQTIQKIKVDNAQMYNIIIGSVDSSKLVLLDQMLEKAIALKEK